MENYSYPWPAVPSPRPPRFVPTGQKSSRQLTHLHLQQTQNSPLDMQTVQLNVPTVFPRLPFSHLLNREGTRGHGKGRKAERAVPLVMKRNCVTVRSIQLSNPFSELYICFPLSGTRALRTRAFFPLMGDTQHNGTVPSRSRRAPSRQQ